MSTWTNAQFMNWLTEARVSSLSQEHLKIEAEKFSGKFEDLDKKTIAKVVENFEKEHKKVRACLVKTKNRIILTKQSGRPLKLKVVIRCRKK